MEIDELLIELDSVTDRMAVYAETSHSHNTATVAHTLTRHRDILQGKINKIEKNKDNNKNAFQTTVMNTVRQKIIFRRQKLEKTCLAQFNVILKNTVEWRLPDKNCTNESEIIYSRLIV